MSGSVNKVILLGNLGRDPEVRPTQDDHRIVTFSLATSERWKDGATGELKERTEWHRVVIRAPHLAEVAERYLTKGRAVYIEGQLQTRKWQDRDGQDRYTTEVVVPPFRGVLVLLGGRSEPTDGAIAGGTEQAASTDTAQARQVEPARPATPRARMPSSTVDLDDEIPF